MPTTEIRVLTAADIMSAPVVTADLNESPIVARARMRAWGVRHLVLVHGGVCAGVVDDRSVLSAWRHSPLGVRHPTLAGLRRTTTTCVLPVADVKMVARVMTAGRVDAVPVVDADGVLLGLVTAGDVAAAVARFGVSVGEEAACGL